MKAGLFNNDNSASDIPLKGVKISGLVCGLFAEIAVEQFFKNEGSKSIEVIYTFPMPDTAAVSDFTAQVGGRRIKGEIREKKEAFKVYDEAINKGDGAYLLEQNRANIFQVSLGHVLPGEEVILYVKYLDRVKYQDGEMRLLIPTLVAPRYIPGNQKGEKTGMGWAEPTDQVPDADFITPPLSRQADYSVELNLILEPLLPLEEVVSPSHSIKTEIEDGGKRRVLFSEGAVLLNKDIVIVGKCRDENAVAGVGWHDNKNNDGYLFLSLYPELGKYEDGGEQKNYIFLIDISGSMHGIKLVQAKNVLQLCLRNLEAGDTFNIVAFESSCHYFSSHSLAFNQESLESATRWVNNLQPMGGTEILEPVKFALNNCNGEETVILLFTDGQVGNEKEITNVVKKKIGRNRLFSFGIDTAVNSYFINSLAEAGGGLPEFIFPGERIEDKVMRQFARITSPLVSDVKVDWGMLKKVEAYPETIRGIFDLEPVILTGKYTGKPEGKVVITGRVKNDSFRTELDLSSITFHQKPDSLKRLWGKMKIEHLENAQDSINPRRRQSIVNNIVNLSIECEVGSAYTSFVAVEVRDNKATGIPETVVVPVSPADGWDMINENIAPMLSLDAPNIQQMHSMSSPVNPPIKLARVKPARGGRVVREASPNISFSDDIYDTAPDTTDLCDDKLLDEAIRFLAMQQMADGSFPVGKKDGDLERETIINTALGLLAIIHGSQNTGIYLRQVEKGVIYLVGALELSGKLEADPEMYPDSLDKLGRYLLAGLILKSLIEKGSLRRKFEGQVKSALKLVVEIVSGKDKIDGYSFISESLNKPELPGITTIIKLLELTRIIDINDKKSELAEAMKDYQGIKPLTLAIISSLE